MLRAGQHQPGLSITCPRLVIPGQPFDVRVRVETRGPLKIEYLDLLLVGIEQVRAAWRGRPVGSETTRQFFDDHRRLCRRVCLAKGTSWFDCRFLVPKGSPATQRASTREISYTVQAHVSVRWWSWWPWGPDARDSWTIEVHGAPPSGARTGKPRRLVSDSTRTGDDRPYVEASVTSDLLAAGDTICGSVALGNVGRNNYTGIRVRLLTSERDPRAGRLEVCTAASEIAVRQPYEGQTYRFQLELPSSLAPSSQEPTRIDHVLELTAHRSGGDVVLELPVTIVAPGIPVTVADEEPTPTIGAARTNDAWREAARRYGHQASDTEVRGAVGDVELTVSREQRGRSGVFLVADLRYPSLRLALAIEPVSGRSDPGADGLQIGVPAWDERHRVTARDPAQVEALLGGLKGILSRYLVTMDDSAARIEYADLGTETATVASFVGAATRLAQRFGALRDTIPAPAAFAGAIDAWRALAGRLAGTLDLAVMAIEGSCAGLPASVRTEFGDGGAPLTTVLEIAPEGTIGDAYRFDAAAPIDVTAARELDPGRRELLRRSSADALRVSIAPDAVTVSLPPQIDDVDGIYRRLRQMAALVRQLAPGAGPYR